MSEATVRSFPPCSWSEHFRKYQWKSSYVGDDCLWKLCLYLDFLADFLVDIYEIINKNNSSNTTKCDLKKEKFEWFKFRHGKLFIFRWYEAVVEKNNRRLLNKLLCKFWVPTHKRSLDVSRGNLNMAMARYRYTSEKIAGR